MIFDICPSCSSPGINVNEEVVKHFSQFDISTNEKHFTCGNSNCNIAYFSEKTSILCSQLKESLWYKDKSLSVQICYCSNLTRYEILLAVYKGSKTIDDVQNSTNKDRTGFCKTENPVGGCCRNVFLFTIEQGKKLQKKSIITCPKCNNSVSNEMPFDNCVVTYKCSSCGEILTPKKGDCCVYCSYGSVQCPTIQLESLQLI